MKMMIKSLATVFAFFLILSSFSLISLVENGRADGQQGENFFNFFIEGAEENPEEGMILGGGGDAPLLNVITICGYITNNSNNNPINEANITLYYSDIDDFHVISSVISDSNGYYTMDVADIGAILLARASGYFSNYVYTYGMNTEDTIWINLTLFPGAPPANSTVCGFITDAITDEPIEDANVFIAWEDYQSYLDLNFTSTNNLGFYTINVPAGDVSILANADGYVPEPSGYFAVDPNSTLWVNISLQLAPMANSIFCGYITDNETGEPIEDAQIWIYSYYYPTNYTYTDDSGFYSIDTVAGEFFILVYADGYFDEYMESINIGAGETLWVNISLILEPPESAIVYGYVTDEITGDPIEGVAVGLYWQNESYPDPEFNFTITNSSGFYSMNVASGEFEIYVFASWEYLSESTGFINISENQTIWVNISLYKPCNPSPADGDINVDVNQILSWAGSSKSLTYDVYLEAGDSTPDILVSSDQSEAFFDPGTLNYNTIYYWEIVAYDEYYNFVYSDTWSFTTEKAPAPPAPPTPPGGPGGGGNTNSPPTADASASETVGFVDTPVIFDGSKSSDPDEDELNYTWDFGDGSTGFEKIITHTYTTAGNYDVKLTVTDGNGGEDDYTFTVNIFAGNKPPTIPDINGQTSGKINILYDYTAKSTDEKNHMMRYIFDWGDGTNTMSDFLPNGTSYSVTHRWNSTGIYTVTVYAEDEYNAISESVELTVLINVRYINDTGYLFDNDGDGIYDTFRITATSNGTAVEFQENGQYLIDSDGDGTADTTHDSISGSVATMSTAGILDEIETSQGIPLIIIMIIAGIVIASILVIVSVVLLRKKEHF